MKSPSRQVSSTYFDIVDNPSARGCPVCVLLSEALRKYFHNLLYENVNDGPTRRTLRSALGYCHAHAEVLLASGDSFGTALLYRDVLEEILSSLQDPSHISHTSNKECPACRYRNRFERIYVGTIREFAGDARMQVALRASGLCRPHTQQVFDESMIEHPKEGILTTQTDHIARMRTTLGEFLRKQDIQFKAEEVTDEEKMACFAAIDFMAGKNV